VQISVAIVDDATIHQLNRQHLGHDYPTDVLSYPLTDCAEKLEGEIVASAETAQRTAPEFGWSCREELCLYVVHGALHLAGYRDATDAEVESMRQAERDVLARLGIHVPDCD
jgi:probable rRNA maturation factor